MEEREDEQGEFVEGVGEVSLYDQVNAIRKHIKEVAKTVKNAMGRAKDPATAGKVEDFDRGEVIANLTLSYRHLEDASMRLGKAMQALDGGQSVYDKATTVGA